MSTNVNTYVMYGILLKGGKLTEIQYDFIEDYIDSPFDLKTNLKDNLTILYDGRSAKYMAIGHVEIKTENHGFFEEPVNFPKYHGPPNFNVISIFQILDAARLSYNLDELNLKWFVISHWR